MEKQALAYLQKGFSVIPVGPDKKPLAKWESYQKTLPTENQIKDWFQNNPNIAIITGAISNLLVVDTDSPESTETVDEMLPVNFVTPISGTPRGGRHYFFQHEEGFPNRANVQAKIDIRTTGGYVVAPPSQNGNGKRWHWIVDILSHETKKIPESLKNFLLASSLPNTLPKTYPYTHPRERHNIALTMPKNLALVEGQRDESLFHIANCLVKGGMHQDDIRYVLEIIAQNCEPPFPEQELNAKIQSALQRAERRERNIADEVNEFVMTTSGHFMTTDVYRELHLTTRNEKKAAVMALLRLVPSTIEKHGSKNGCYRRIENEEETLDFIEGGIVEYPVKMPFRIHDLCKLYRKNIIIVAGSKNAGKTAFLLDIAFKNQDTKSVVYVTSEMAHEEWTERITLLGKEKKDIRFKTLIKSANFHDKVTGEDKIFLIDFLEIHENFWEIAKYIRMIHDKLHSGIAFVALQKKRGVELARGQDFSMEKARLYLSLDYIEYMGGCTKVSIVEAKAPKYGRSVRGAYKRVKISAQKMESLDEDWLVS